MTDASHRFRDRTGWCPGPWDAEPDAVSWVSAVGLPCEMRRNHMGIWCGYVGMDPSHVVCKSDDAVEFDVHGEVTWNGSSEELSEPCMGGIAVPSGLRWIGFDCLHHRDASPMPEMAVMRQIGGIYRDLAYVRAECERLAAQIDAVGLLGEAGFDALKPPSWAAEYVQRFHVPRAERLEMLRRLATDPVAAQLAEAMGIAG